MAYDSSAVAVHLGGFDAYASGATTIAQSQTHIDTVNTIACAGTINQIKLSTFYSTGYEASVFKFKVLRIVGTDYTVVHDATSLVAEWDLLTSGVFTVLTKSGLSIDVQEGDLIAIYYVLDTAGTRGALPDEQAGGNIKSIASDITGTTAIADVGFSDNAGNTIQCEITGTTGEYLLTDDSSPTAGALIPIAYPTATPFYLILEDVDVANGEVLDIHLQYTTSASEPTSDRIITVDFSGADAADVIKFTTAAPATVGTEHVVAGSVYGANGPGGAGRGQKFNFLLWIDPANATVNNELFYTNFDKGMGTTGGDKDISLINYYQRSNRTNTNILNNIIITQTTGTPTVGRVVVARDPVLAYGDSYVSQHDGTSTSLAHVAEQLGALFTKTRYVINGGIAGNKILVDSAATSTANRKRWNFHEGNPEDLANSDYVMMRDVVVVFVNGPCINDIVTDITSSSTDAEIGAFAQRLSSDIGRMVGEAAYEDADINNLGSANDTIMCGLVPNTAGDAATNLNVNSCVDQVNTLLNEQAAVAKIPFIKVANMGVYLSDGTHLSTAGDTEYARRIAVGYENNRLAKSATGGSDYRSRYS